MMTESASELPQPEREKVLDGLRGVSALAVFFSHFAIAFYPLGLSNYYPWIAPKDGQRGWAEELLSMPFVSVLWNGNFQVCIFFVLSGYVLTKPFIEQGDVSIIQKRAARRFLRLAIPVFASVMLAYALMKFGAYQALSTAAIIPSPWLTALNSLTDPTFKGALFEGIIGTLLYGEATYVPALWTMRIELIGSMLIFAYCLLASPGKRGFALAALYVALAFAFSPASWPLYVAFLLGMYVGRARLQTNKSVTWICLLSGLGLGSATFGFGTLDTYMWFQQSRFALLSVAGAGLVFYAVRNGAFANFFESHFSQFLGRISYPLYLVHMPIIFSLSCGVYNALVLQYGLFRWSAALIALFVTLPTTLSAAWLFEILIDAPAVRLTRRLF